MEGHISVLYERVMEHLNPRRGGVYVDGTLGGGGHALGILESGATRLVAIDKDESAIARCKQWLVDYAQRITYVHSDYSDITKIMGELGIQGADGALLDLGVSSYQLDEEERGFSYSKDAPLDMRMDRSNPLSANEVVNEYSPEKLCEILYKYGEEKFSSRITNAIVKARPISRTGELAEIVKSAIPAPARRKGGNPAKRTFQGIRIEVNGELDKLESTIGDFIEMLNPMGRLAVITFHSLEDRAVKNAFKRAQNPCTCPHDFPMCICGNVSRGRILTRKPILPTDEEIAKNGRSASAKLRVFERCPM